MIEPYVQKVIFVDQQFLDSLEQKSMTDYVAFKTKEVDTQIISLPMTPAEVRDLSTHVHPSEIRAGGVLVKPDYSDQFMSVDAFAESHADRKYGLWVCLCLALGAKKVSVSNIEEISLEAAQGALSSGHAGADVPLGSAEAGFKGERSNRSDEARKSIMNIKVDATGGEPDLAEAERIMSSHGLHKDEMFQRVYDMRRLKSNAVSRKEFSLDLSADVKRVFDSSLKAKIKVMNQLYGGGAEFDKVHKSVERSRTALKLSVIVEF